MPRGFTLLELIIALLVVITLLAGAGPNFSAIHQHYQMRKQVSELRNMFVQARSEAVMRNQKLTMRLRSNSHAGEEWSLKLYPSGGEEPSVDKSILYRNNLGVVITSVRWTGHRRTEETGPSQIELAFDKVNGKPVRSGELEFYSPGAKGKNLRLKYSAVSGRISLCGVGGEHYGYPGCE